MMHSMRMTPIENHNGQFSQVRMHILPPVSNQYNQRTNRESRKLSSYSTVSILFQ